jgi:hypothetical protein
MSSKPRRKTWLGLFIPPSLVEWLGNSGYRDPSHKQGEGGARLGSQTGQEPINGNINPNGNYDCRVNPATYTGGSIRNSVSIAINLVLLLTLAAVMGCPEWL